MKAGVIADTHDNLAAINFVVQDLIVEGCEILLHAGDFISPFTVPELAKFPGPVRGVFGNNDGDQAALQEQAADTQVKLAAPPLKLELNKRDILLAHIPADLPDSVESEEVLIHGHSHHPRVEKEREQLLINPGEVGGWLTGTTHHAILDLETLSAEVKTAPAP